MICKCQRCSRESPHHIACVVHVYGPRAKCDCGLDGRPFQIPRHIAVREEPCECGACVFHSVVRVAQDGDRLRVMVVPPFLFRSE